MYNFVPIIHISDSQNQAEEKLSSEEIWSDLDFLGAWNELTTDFKTHNNLEMTLDSNRHDISSNVPICNLGNGSFISQSSKIGLPVFSTPPSSSRTPRTDEIENKDSYSTGKLRSFKTRQNKNIVTGSDNSQNRTSELQMGASSKMLSYQDRLEKLPESPGSSVASIQGVCFSKDLDVHPEECASLQDLGKTDINSLRRGVKRPAAFYKPFSFETEMNKRAHNR